MNMHLNLKTSFFVNQNPESPGKKVFPGWFNEENWKTFDKGMLQRLFSQDFLYLLLKKELVVASFDWHLSELISTCILLSKQKFDVSRSKSHVREVIFFNVT